MKKILTLTAVGVILTVPAMAVVQCVALNSDNTSCVSEGDYREQPDWALVCTTGTKKTTVRGVSFCLYDDFYSLRGAGQNTYCWCMVTVPFRTSMFYVKQFSTEASCYMGCPDACMDQPIEYLLSKGV